ncbi:hypothetical protein PGAL8A_00311600 [Plasmodium gallinaceum]|uniref:Uncharacterized protein n=1 Tax=Plasmodium gallinaceum TaxID=5849 RepID=A0A1J1GTX4_PLAGA|nr:hypothetical protein PGAL8A_00311600 [Plasmodium gallinaceum]CRG95903.1 hypothetical protein PGAL8A_00311600 [Plasmodium gallinaceum]
MHDENKSIMKKGENEQDKFINRNNFNISNCTNIKDTNVENIDYWIQQKKYKELIKKIDDKNESNNKKNCGKNYIIYGDGLKGKNFNSKKLYKDLDKIKSDFINRKSSSEENLKDSKNNIQNYNNIEHYNIMSSTDPSLSSNNSITEMYETNYNYFTNFKGEMSELPISSYNLKIKSIPNHNINKYNNLLKNIYLNNKDIKTKKLYENISVNLKKKNENKIKKEYSNLQKYKDTLLYKSRYIYLKQIKSKNSLKKNGTNFNLNTHNNRNIQIKYEPINKLINKNILFLGSFNKMKNRTPHKIKYISKYKNHFKKVHHINESYLNGKFKKKRNNCIFLDQHNSKNIKSIKNYYIPFILQNIRKNQSILNDIINYSYIKNMKDENLLNNSIDYRPKKSKGIYRRITCKNKCVYTKNAFTNLMEKLKLLGYALFFCFFFTNKTKSTKDKANI